MKQGEALRNVEKIVSSPLSGRDFCHKLTKREAFEKMPKVAIVTAHADDEVIGYGTVLSQLPEALTIQVTDSTPKVPTSIGQFSTVDEFKAHIKQTRRDELDTALNLAGHNPYSRECLGYSDQDVMNKITETALALTDKFRKERVEFVMTHAYEGGHPDHDAVTAAVHLTKELLAKENIPVTIIETPLYKGVPGKPNERIWQEFAEGFRVSANDTFVKKLTPEEVELKRKLYAAHASQAHVFTKTFDDRELFRVAPTYDFNIPPNNGVVSNIFPEFGLTHDKWRELIHDARWRLGL